MHKYVLQLALVLVLISSSLARPVEHYFKFKINDRSELEKLTQIISISSVQGNVVFAYANEEEMAEFAKLGYLHTKLEHPGMISEPHMAPTLDDLASWDSYPSYDQYVAMMYQFASNYPDLCEIHDIGATVQGRSILFARISDNVGVAENEPELMYISTMHGDETVGYILMLRLIDSLLSAYGADPEVTNLVNNSEIWISPLINPDGTYITGDASVSGATRYNANLVDLNRNFPDPSRGDHPDGKAWQPETIALMNFAASRNFVHAATFHGGAEVVNYPWDCWPRLHADDPWYVAISRQYADSAQYYSPSGYLEDQNFGITNGWDWYPVYGGHQDYMNFWHGCRETVIELSDIKLVQGSTLPQYWEYNRVSMFDYLRQALFGIKGVVTDAQTGDPIDAMINLVEHDMDSSDVHTDPDFGDYHRMVAAGTYEVLFTAEGYQDVTIADVAVVDGQVTVLDVTMASVVADYICGDVDGSEQVDGNDIVYMVNYFYKSGPVPPALMSADVDGSGQVDGLDLAYLVAYMFKGGPELICEM